MIFEISLPLRESLRLRMLCLLSRYMILEIVCLGTSSEISLAHIYMTLHEIFKFLVTLTLSTSKDGIELECT